MTSKGKNCPRTLHYYTYPSNIRMRLLNFWKLLSFIMLGPIGSSNQHQLSASEPSKFQKLVPTQPSKRLNVGKIMF